ncbi:hypothetical protein QQ045_023517 [Rhodiola kirilowii]
MAPKQPNTGLFVGLNKGHIVTKKELAPRPSDRKGKTSKRVHFVRSLIREVAGFAPYEKRITELLKVGKDKRALKVAKRKLGTHKRAKRKREEMSSVLRKMRYAVVTGGNKGVGFEICKLLAAKGVVVILAARNEQRGSETVEKLKACGLSDNAVFHQLDVADPSSVVAFADFVRTQFGKLDILVNNAAVTGNNFIPDIFLKAVELAGGNWASDWLDLHFCSIVFNFICFSYFIYLMSYLTILLVQPFERQGEIAEQTYEMGVECILTNYYGTTSMVKALLPLLQLSDAGRIVNISSMLGDLSLIPNEWAKGVFTDMDNLTEDAINEVLVKFLDDYKADSLKANDWPPSFSAYTLSKAAMNAYTRMIAKTHPGILTNCVCPGFVKTEMTLNTGLLTAEEAAAFPVKLLFCPMARHQFLTENTDFIVVGVIGPTGVGKSTIMNEIYGFDGSLPGQSVHALVSFVVVLALFHWPLSPSTLSEMIRLEGSSTISVLSGESLTAELAHVLMAIQVTFAKMRDF